MAGLISLRNSCGIGCDALAVSLVEMVVCWSLMVLV